AWNINTGSAGVIVAVIDTGLDYLHPDLAANVWVNALEQAGTAGVDDDGNGYIDDIYGIDPAGTDGSTPDTDPMDGYGHGTHLSGTIGAVGNNSLGVVGVNWNVKIMGLKFSDDAGGNGFNSYAIECIEYAIDQKANHGQNVAAINASWGSSSFDQVLMDAIEAAGEAGIIFCAAAGNGGSDAIGDDNDSVPYYPAALTLDCIITVAATDDDDLRGSFSNYGATSVDLGAPGVGILSTVPGSYIPQAGDIFFDDMESGVGNWVTGGTNNSWAITTNIETYWGSPYPQAPSPPHFWSDSPAGYYGINTDSTLTYNADIDLSSHSGQDVYLGMGSGRHVATGDHFYVEISNDSGASWAVLQDWQRDGYLWYWASHVWQIPDSYKTAHFRMRFHLVSDGNYTGVGWVIDNIGIGTTITYDYDSWNGTSMATPHVAGAVALMASQFPGESAADRRNRILGSVDPLAALAGKCTSGGRLNLYQAITASSGISVTSPNGGEAWLMGSAHDIHWTSFGGMTHVKIEYSLNNGGSWVVLTASTPNDGSHSWAVPYSPSSQCLVRISNAGSGTPSDVSNAAFSILAEAISPIRLYLRGDSGRILGLTPETTGITRQHTWNSGSVVWTGTDVLSGDITGNSYTFHLYAASAGSTSFRADLSIGGSVVAQYYFSANSTTYYLKHGTVTGSDPALSGPSTVTLTIYYLSGSSGGILFGDFGSDDSLVDLPGYSQNDSLVVSGTVTRGGTALPDVVMSGLPGSPATDSNGFYTAAVDNGWSGTVTPVLASHVFNPASRSYSSISANQENQDYSATLIVDSITVTSPNGGESWTAGTSHGITWTSTGTVGNVDILYTVNGGSNWTSIAADTNNDGSFAWTVANTPSANCYVQVLEHADGVPYDSSNAAFTIAAPAETVSAPTTPTGPASGVISTSYDYSTGGSTSNLGHSVQYKFDWDDGTDSGWLAVGTTTASHSWAAAGTYDVRAMARCADHTAIESLWSTTLAVIISDPPTSQYNSPTQYKVLPEVIWASATGGGTWMSNVQVTDVTGGSIVSVYYNTGTGRRGPFQLWDNSGGAALSSAKYANLLETIDGLDAETFAYYGTVGAVEFITQDGAHTIHAAARTLNGYYAKTFSAVSLHDANTATTSRAMVVSNLTNNAGYRSTAGCSPCSMPATARSDRSSAGRWPGTSSRRSTRSTRPGCPILAIPMTT
ncbi:MAG: S8 family serine peptidase, partial [Acidobacteria bacterium]|nr:S8 family serine peptidase [Acidobacteriota bacterium]